MSKADELKKALAHIKSLRTSVKDIKKAQTAAADVAKKLKKLNGDKDFKKVDKEV